MNVVNLLTLRRLLINNGNILFLDWPLFQVVGQAFTRLISQGDRSEKFSGSGHEYINIRPVVA